MTAYRHKWTGKRVSVIEPVNDLNKSFGFCKIECISDILEVDLK